jgi:hypothetical protein
MENFEELSREKYPFYPVFLGKNFHAKFSGNNVGK